MRRREFIAGLGGAAAAWPPPARAQQGERVRRVGVLLGWTDSSPMFRSFLDAFIQELAHLGWVDGRNVRIEQRWTNADLDRTGSLAKELIELKPEVILASTTPATAALQREGRPIPIVFTIVSDPVGIGFVASLARPGGDLTGFIHLEAESVGKQLNFLKEIAPSIKRAAIMFNPDTAPRGGNYYLGSFEAAARSLNLEPISVRVRTDAEVETAIISLGRQQTGLVLMEDSFMGVHQTMVVSLGRGTKLPAITSDHEFVKEGGLISYGPSFQAIFRRAASYVDRILRGAKPSDLPVELPIKFNLAINLKTAKALGLTVPNALLALADDVIE
jgi:putative tryptophan/tyrosine transport system substrate-binding protein